MRTESNLIATEFRLIIEVLRIGHQREDSPGRAGHRAGGEETDSGG